MKPLLNSLTMNKKEAMTIALKKSYWGFTCNFHNFIKQTTEHTSTMKANWLLTGLCSIVFLLFSSCEKENDFTYDDFPQGNGKLKCILLYADIDSDTPINIIEEYEYDKEERVSRVSSPMYQDGEIVGTIKYDLYAYNSKGQLTEIKNYNANTNAPSGFLNLKTCTYTYSADGRKKKEYIAYPQINSYEYSLFTYDQNRLVRVDKYGSTDELESYIVNEYDESGYVIKESSYAYDDRILSYTRHVYTEGLHTQSDVFTGKNSDHLRQILRSYDENRNLIVLESKELSPVSSMMSYVLRYEYF